MSNNFTDFQQLDAFIKNKESGHILVAYQNLPDYAGMVLGILMLFDIPKKSYKLKLEWISFGLDLFGENLMEDYTYKFDSLEKLLEYIHFKYDIAVNDIPIKYSIDQSQYPNPIKDKDQEPLFEKEWNRFQEDFRKGLFLDGSLDLANATLS